MIKEKGGKGLLQLYNDSIFNLLDSVFPEFHFSPFKFAKPNGIYIFFNFIFIIFNKY